MGYGEEIFTLTAKGFGTCLFRLAYARAWDFTTFEEFAEQNGYMISIPIRVLKEDEMNKDGTPVTDTTEEDTFTEETFDESQCNPNFETCDVAVYDWSME